MKKFLNKSNSLKLGIFGAQYKYTDTVKPAAALWGYNKPHRQFKVAF